MGVVHEPVEDAVGQPEGVRAGQIRSFKITAIDLEKKKVEIEMQA